MQNADTAKQLTAKQQSQEEVARVKEQLAFQMEQVKRESELKLEEQSDQLEKLRRELEAKAGELVRVQEALSHTEQVGVGRLASDGTGVRVLFPRERALPGCHWVGSGVPGGCCDPVRRGLAGSGKLGASWGW